MKNRFTTASGKLNPNWKKILEKEPHWLEELNKLPGKYDIKTRLMLVIHGLREMPKCKTCGNDVKTVGSTYCSKKCSANDPEVKAKQVANTDVAEKNRKIRETHSNKTDTEKSEYTKRGWETRKSLYGDSGFSQNGIASISSEEVKSRRLASYINTCMTRYGVDNVSKLERVKTLISQKQSNHSSSRAHLPAWMYDKTEFTQKWNEHGFEGIKTLTGCGNNLLHRLTVQYGIRPLRTTLAEEEIASFIRGLGFDVIQRTRAVISPKELDIYVPSKNLAIEFDGLYWHSCDNKSDENEFKYKHVDKTNSCEAIGISLLHIFEDEWNDPTKREIWKSVIKQKLGVNKRIYARKTELRDVSSKEANLFCQQNHLQGSARHTYAKGLYLDDELVMLATFGKSRFEDANELIRMCTKMHYTVVGGASKLLKGESYVSYANRRWSSGGVYQAIGMKKVSVTAPNYFYVKDDTRYSRHQYMKSKLADRLETYDPELTESENCYRNGLRKIFDCGNIKYTA